MRAIKRSYFPSLKTLIISGVVFGIFLVGFILYQVAGAQSNLPESGDGRLITIYDRGTERVVLSKAATIGAVLEDASIHIDENDMVEPRRDEKLVATNYNVNIYRARPVIVVDGNTRQKIMTPYQTPEQIADDAGVELYDEDIAEVDRVDNILMGGAGLEMTIDRSIAFTLILYGKKTEARTSASTVGDMLKAKDITIGKQDTLSVKEATPITKGMTVELWRNGVQTVTEEEAIDFPIEQIRDADREIGYREIETPGVKGERTVTYEINMQNGQETSRKEIQSVVTKEPKKQVEVVGTKSAVMPYTGGGSKTDWLSASSIPEASWGAADFIVSQESGWNPNAVNASSGACGLAQALPCSKVPGNPYDPVNSLNWMNGYVTGRYGSWENAVSFKRANGWY